MIIAKKLGLNRVMAKTWRTLLFLGLVCVLAYFFNAYVLQRYVEFPSIIPAILAPALAFFIGFNNNQAYDRWWEARKIWGSLVNDSRSWARQLMHYLSGEDSVIKEELDEIKKRTIYRHIAFLYALKEKLRGDESKNYRKYLSEEEVTRVEFESNTHNAILNEQSRDLEYLYKNGVLDGFKFLELNKMIINFCDEMGKSERIKNTVYPVTYIFYTRVFIWVLVIDVTFVVGNLIGPWAIFFGILVGYVFIVTHAIGLAILNPFEPVASGIPLDQITRTIEINLLEALGEKEIPEPVKSINNEYVM